jgi:hypothetical protein
MSRYFVDLDLWAEDDNGEPIYTIGPAASFTGWVEVTENITTYEPEKVACMLAENNARTAAGWEYQGTWGIATVNTVRPESLAERLSRLGYVPLFYSYRMPPLPPSDEYHIALFAGLISAKVERI